MDATEAPGLRRHFFAGFDTIPFPTGARWCAVDSTGWETYGNQSWPSSQSALLAAHGLGVQAANTVVFLTDKGIALFRDLSFTADEYEPGKWRMRWVFCAKSE